MAPLTAKTYEFKGEIYSKIPNEIARTLHITPGDEITFENKEGRIVLSAGSKSLSNDEFSVLKKIGAMRHYDRTINNVEKALSEGERITFVSMLKKKILFKCKKENRELVGIDKPFFSLITEQRSEDHPLITSLFADGFAVVEDASAVSFLTNELMRTERSGDVRGVRGFDKKFYIVTSVKMGELTPKIEKALDSERSLSDVASIIGVSEELCKAAIEVLKEDGDVIEKKKDVFARA
jgi:bifunctional DNA-binding transcriptional regulator/antitoxin component of YhaV-PrlF toxin-antitoxin module